MSRHQFRAGSLLLSAIGLAVLIAQCSSVQEVPTTARALLLPRLQFFDPGAAVTAGTDADYKRRERSRPGIRIVVPAGPTGADQLPRAVRSMVFDAAVAGLRFPDVTIIRPESPDVLRDFPGPASLAALREMDADAVLVVRIETFESQNGGAEVELRDPVDGSVFGARRLTFSVERDGRKGKSEADFHIRNGRVRAVADRSSVGLRLETPPRSTMRQLLELSVSGSLSVLATAPGARVFVRVSGDRRTIGQAPVQGVRLPEGRCIVEVARRGYAAFEQEVIVRAGKEVRIQASWPGDTSSSSLSVLSAPPGLRLAIDGVVRGETPVFLTDLQSGAYGLEVSRPGPDGNFQVQADGRARLGGENSDRLAFFVKLDESFGPGALDGGLWQLASEEGAVRFTPNNGLGIKGEGPATAWRGLASVPTLPEDLEAALDAIQAPGNEFVFLVLGGAESVMVELRGDRWSLVRFRGQDTIAPPRDFRALREGNAHRIRFQYVKKKSQLTVRLDESVLFEGPWKPGESIRFALLTRGASADGRPLAARLQIRTGRGLAEP